MSRENPCKKCTFGLGKQGSTKYFPGCGMKKYRECVSYKEHEKYLESRRKYRMGDTITSLDDLMKCKFVYWHGRITHIEWIASMQLRVVILTLNSHGFRKAIRKERDVK